jgi:hypothetical protein
MAMDEDDTDEHRLNIDETKEDEQRTNIDDNDEQSSDDEQVRSQRDSCSCSIDVVKYRSRQERSKKEKDISNTDRGRLMSCFTLSSSIEIHRVTDLHEK